MSKGRLEEAQTIIDNVARVNGISTAPRLQETVDNSSPKASSEAAVVSPVALFRVPRLLIRYMLLYICW